ncbi:RHS repeat-associated core domain-containing protein [Streptomyces sp. NPDC087894]|uniref:RHS repeat-associated core domain-containing protein n=1 Tax=Streptomyces sp. NPDC087894 TaxID=3365816 RepID=UPI003828F0E9
MGAAQTVTRRKQLPFGGQRGTTGSSSWPGDRGFVGGTSDPTGYTHLGAREYDPTLGRFLSVDPLLIPDDPTQLNPYVYGNNNPATFADPTGEAYEECVSGQYNCTYGKGGTGDVKKVIFGKNYEKETRARGGKVSKNYYAQQTTGRKYTYTKGKGMSTRYTGYEYRQAEKLRQEKEKHKQYLNKREAELEALRNPPEDKSWSEDAWNGVSGFFAEHSDSIKAGIGVLAFGACFVASAGTCLVVAVAGLSMSAALDQNSGIDTTTTEYRTQTGFLFGVTVAGVGGATWLTRGANGGMSWRQAFTKSPRETATHGRTNWGPTRGNYVTNFGFTSPTCGGTIYLNNNAGYCG